MKKSEKELNGHKIFVDWQQVEDFTDKLYDTMEKSDIAPSDALTALVIASCSIAYGLTVPKSFFLSKITSLWEKMEEEEKVESD